MCEVKLNSSLIQRAVVIIFKRGTVQISCHTMSPNGDIHVSWNTIGWRVFSIHLISPGVEAHRSDII